MQVTEESKVAYQISSLCRATHRESAKVSGCDLRQPRRYRVTTKASPAGKLLYLLQKPDGAGGRNLIFERVRIDVEFDHW